MQFKGSPYIVLGSWILIDLAGESLFSNNSSNLNQPFPSGTQILTASFRSHRFQISLLSSSFLAQQSTEEMIHFPSNLQKKPWCVCPILSQQLEHFHTFQTKKHWISWNISTSTAGCWTWKVAKVSSSALDADVFCIYQQTWDTTGENHRLIVLVGGIPNLTLFDKRWFFLGNEKNKIKMRDLHHELSDQLICDLLNKSWRNSNFCN